MAIWYWFSIVAGDSPAWDESSLCYIHQSPDDFSSSQRRSDRCALLWGGGRLLGDWLSGPTHMHPRNATSSSGPSPSVASYRSQEQSCSWHFELSLYHAYNHKVKTVENILLLTHMYMYMCKPTLLWNITVHTFFVYLQYNLCVSVNMYSKPKSIHVWVNQIR